MNIDQSSSTVKAFLYQIEVPEVNIHKWVLNVFVLEKISLTIVMPVVI